MYTKTWLRLLLAVMGVVTGAVTGATADGQEEAGSAAYDLLLLLPLTGPQARRGRALMAGVQASLPPGAVNQSQPGSLRLALPADDGRAGTVDVQFIIVDTQCDQISEDDHVSRHLADKGRRLVVIGGLCPQAQHDLDVDSLQRSLYVRRNLPQVTFTESFVPHTHLAVSPVTLQPSVRATYQSLLSWLRRTSCRHVALLVTPNKYNDQKETLILREELEENKVMVSLQVETSNSNILLLLKQSRARVVILQNEAKAGLQQLCHLVSETRDSPTRYIWVLLVRGEMTPPLTSQQPCQGLQGYTIILFRSQMPQSNTQEYKDFSRILQRQEPEISADMFPEAAMALDTVTMTLQTMKTLHKVVPRTSRQQFTDRFMHQLTRGAERQITGNIEFDERGLRAVKVELLILDENGFHPPNGSNGAILSLNYSEVGRQVSLQGIPLAVFVVMTSLALVGTAYGIGILIFNLLKRNDKMIKMTSPNINMVIVLGAIMGYIAMVTLGLDSNRVSLQSMAKLAQASTFLLSIGYSLAFGSLFAKAWRVFFIFKNLNANGKNTRDEHLLFGVFLLVVADLIILIPWAAADPITCTHVYTSDVYQPAPPTDVIYQSDVCASSLHVMWVLVLYLLKGGVLVAGLYFTFQTRHISLPTLKDAREVYEVVYTVGVVSLLCLPVILSPALSVPVRYAVGAVAIFTVVTATLTLCFVPKIYLLWRRADKASPDSIRFLFSESLRRTQRHLASCSLCCCIGGGGEDKYAQEVLGSEIDTLKRTIKEKDATIRELTDRLYFGTEKKLHEYISSPRRFSTLTQEGSTGHHQRVRTPSQLSSHGQGLGYGGTAHPVEAVEAQEASPESTEAMFRSYCRRSRRSERNRRRSPHVASPCGIPTHYEVEEGAQERRDPGVRGSGRGYMANYETPGHNGVLLQTPGSQQHQQSPLPASTPPALQGTPDSVLHTSYSKYSPHTYNGYIQPTILTDSGVPKYSTPSPNHDSAIDNNSPSSAGSDQDMLQHTRFTINNSSGGSGEHDATWRQPSVLDLDAIEQEVTCSSDYYYPQAHSAVNSYFENGVAVSQI